jgi:hypothetical protein
LTVIGGENAAVSVLINEIAQISRIVLFKRTCHCSDVHFEQYSLNGVTFVNDLIVQVPNRRQARVELIVFVHDVLSEQELDIGQNGDSPAEIFEVFDRCLDGVDIVEGVEMVEQEVADEEE